MSLEEKYLKYKSKYLNLKKSSLKNMSGGTLNGRTTILPSVAYVPTIPENFNNFLHNIMLLTDSYKLNHWQMYKKLKITNIYSYLEARDGKTEFTHTVWFGLHYLLKNLQESIKDIPTLIDFSEQFTYAHFTDIGKTMFNRNMWDAISDLGYLPLEIKSAEEGSVINVGNVLLTIQNTDGPHQGKSGKSYDKSLFAPLVNHLESYLLQVWYPSTVATMSRSVRDMIVENIKETCNATTAGFLIDNVVPYLLHDFGYRGVSSNESAAIGGLAHLLNFIGTDTVPAILLGIKDYGVRDMPGFSVPATEHSIMTSYGMDDGVKDFLPQHLTQPKGQRIDEAQIDALLERIDTYLNGYASYTMVDAPGGGFVMQVSKSGKKDDRNEFYIIRQLMEEYPLGILSMVMDSYNIFVSVAYVCKNLKDCLLFRLAKGSALGIPVNKAVFRPDSQEPEEVLPILVKIIAKYFGKTDSDDNTKIHRKGGENTGFYSLPDCTGLLWGDGMQPKTVKQLLDNAKTGWAAQGYVRVGKFNAANFIFGMGGGLLQKVNRDSQRFAFKCAANKFEGDSTWYKVQKNPVGRVIGGVIDKSEHKVSKAGKLQLTRNGDRYNTQSLGEGENLLKPVYLNGTMYPNSSAPTLDVIHEKLKGEPIVKLA